MKYFQKNPMIMLFVGVLGVSMSSILVRYSQAPSAVTAAYRLLWSALLLAPVALGKREFRKELSSVSLKVALLSVCSGICLAIHFVLWFESLKHTSVASSTTIVCTDVIFVCIGYWLFLKGKLTVKALMAIGIMLTGSVLIALSDASSGGGLYGDILALLAAIAIAAYTLIGSRVRAHLSTTAYTFLVYTACAVVLVITCLFQGYSLAGFGWSPVLVGLLLAVFSTLLGHSLFSWCLKFYSPAFVSACKLCEPVVAALIAIPLFHEIPQALQLCGSALILGGVFWYSYMESK